MRHLKVLEFSSEVPAAWCGRQLALWGADVIFVEDDAGSPLRTAAPNVASEGKRHPLLWENVHRGKRSIRSAGVTDTLWSGADIIVTDREELAARKRDDQVVVRLTPLGITGPEAGAAATELTVEAAAGYLSLNGSPDRPPLRAPGHLIGYYCGVNAFVGALAALHKRERTGFGETVEISWLESVAAMVPFVRAQYAGTPETRLGGPGSGVRVYPIGDGWLSLNLRPNRVFAALVEALGIAAEDVPEDVATAEKRGDDEAVFRFLREHAADVSGQALFARLNAAGMPPTGIVYTPRGLLADPHLEAIGGLVDHAVAAGKVRTSGPPAVFQSMEPVAGGAAPGEPAAELAWREAEPRAARRRASAGRDTAPLAGIRILDFTQAWIGPFATQMLADLGADVIKVESPARPDVWRGAKAPGEDAAIVNATAHPLNTGGRFNGANRNKRGLCLDLATERGRALALDLVRDADLVVDNFTPRVMGKLGLGYEDLRAVNERIIAVSFSGYGPSGPYADYKANGTTIEAIAGWDTLFCYPGGNPMAMGFYQADAITGMHLAATALMALHHRERTGEGQAAVGSMVQAALTYVGEEIMWASLGRDHPVHGNDHPDMVLQGVFPAAGDPDSEAGGRWVAISIRDQRDEGAIEQLVGEADVPLAARLAAWTEQRPAAETVRVLRGAGLPVAEVRDTLDVLEQAQLKGRGWFVPVSHPDTGTHLYHGFPWRFANARLEVRRPAPRIGEHSREILTTRLDLSQEAVDALMAEGVTGEVLDSAAELKRR